MNVVVTGGLGYVGSHVAAELRARGHVVWVLDDASNAPIPSDRYWRGNNLSDVDRLVVLLQSCRPDAVVHCAALTSAPDSLNKPRLYYDVNVVRAMNVASAMVRINCKRLVFASSAAAANPMSPYGESKRVVDQMLADMTAAKEMSAVSLRLENVSGVGAGYAGRNQRYTRLVAMAARDKSKIAVRTSDGERMARDFVYVGDVARAFALAVEGDMTGVYSIGTGEATYIEMLASAHGVEFFTMDSTGGELTTSRAEPERFEAVTGFRPRVGMMHIMESEAAALERNRA